jgi:hypothetical protein
LFILQSTSGNFLGIFGISWVFFVPLNIFWDFPEFVLHWKIISEKYKTYPFLPGRARRPDPLQLARPGVAHPAMRG